MSGSHAVAHADGSRGSVREGLGRLVARRGAPPAGDAPADERARWRNALLDEVGSDARPLVELLLRVQAHGVVAQLPRGPLAPGAWGPIRARLAFQYATETYLDAEMARWAVDAWAYAVGTIDAAGLYVAPPAAPLPGAPPAARPAPAAAAGAAPHAAATGVRAAAAPAAWPGQLPPGTLPPGRLPGRVRRAIARANAPPAPNPFPKNFDRIAGLTFVGMVTAAAVAMWFGIVARREAGGGGPAGARPRASGPRPADVGAGGGAGVAAAGGTVLPGVGMPEAVIAPLPGAARTPPDPEAGGALAVDSLRLRDGTVRTGLVERLEAGALVLRDPWSDGAARLDLADVVEWRPRRGAVLPVGAAPDSPDPAASDPAASDPAAAGAERPARRRAAPPRGPSASPAATRCAGASSTCAARRAAAPWPTRCARPRRPSRPWSTARARRRSRSPRAGGCGAPSTRTAAFAPSRSKGRAAACTTASAWSASSSRAASGRKRRTRPAPFCGGATSRSAT
jgi:hypothetical protein